MMSCGYGKVDEGKINIRVDLFPVAIPFTLGIIEKKGRYKSYCPMCKHSKKATVIVMEDSKGKKGLLWKCTKCKLEGRATVIQETIDRNSKKKKRWTVLRSVEKVFE